MSLAQVYAWEGRHDVGARIRAARRVRLLERAFSRRQMMKTLAGASGAVLGAGMLLPTLTQAADGSDPKPIPTGIQPLGAGTETFHLYLPESGSELSTITDFNGMIAAAEIQGTGMGTDATGAKMPLVFDVDARLMQGQYVGMDGQVRTGAFALI